MCVWSILHIRREGCCIYRCVKFNVDEEAWGKPGQASIGGVLRNERKRCC